MENSKKYALNKSDLKKIGIGLGIALGGALLTHLSGVVANVDFGTWTPVVMAAWSVVVNVSRKFLTDYTKQ